MKPLLKYMSYLFLFSLSFYVFSGAPTLYSKQDLSRKYDVLTFSCTFFLFSLVLMLCDSMFQRGPSLCRSVLRTVCCYGLFPRGLCVHSSPKNRASLWQHHCRLTCDMLERFLGICLTPSLNLCFYLFFSFFPSSSNIIFLLCFFCLQKTSPFFAIVCIPIHSIISISVWHMIVAVKTALILDNTHFVGCSVCWLTGGTQRYKNRIRLL